MADIHSKIAPSKAERWMNCPGSLILEDQCPPAPQTVYAAEGTAAHRLAAMCLMEVGTAREHGGEKIRVASDEFIVNEEMIDSVQLYLDTIEKDMNEDGLDSILNLMVEHKFTLPSISSALYGTTDAAYTSPFGTFRVYDLKYGRGTFVDVVDNPQLLIYLLGAWHESGRVAEEMEIVIVQPRCGTEDLVRRATYTRKDLLKFEKELKKAVTRVHDNCPDLKVGNWCKFCPAMAICKVKQAQVFDVVAVDEVAMPEIQTLTEPQIAKILKLSEVMGDWVAAVHAHAEGLAKQGVKIPGYKLVARKGNRRWIDEAVVETAFEAEIGEEIYTKKLKSPAQLEKIVGKDRVSEYVEVPDNGVQLVPESAKGEAIQAASEMFKKIEEK